MKRFLTLLFCAFTNFNSDAQYDKGQLYNAYGLAKEMVVMQRLMKSDKPTSDHLKDSMQDIIGALVWYADLQDEGGDTSQLILRAALKPYSKIQAIYDDMLRKLYVLDFLDSESSDEMAKYFKKELNNDKLYDNAEVQLNSLLKMLFENRQSLSVCLQEEKDKKVEIASLRKDSSDFEQDLSKRSTIDTSTTTDTSFLQQKEKDLLTLVEYKMAISKKEKDLEAFVQSIQKIKNEIQNEKDRLVNYFRNYVLDDDLTKLLKSLIGKNNDWNKELERIDAKIGESQTNFYKAKAELETPAQQSALSFRLPSEAEMIDAVAIYLAKRVKQESVMWFFETIKKNANQYELISTFFPNTLTLLQSNEVYDIPNLGAQWRYALSKDFVKMPRNVFASKWFTDWYAMVRPNQNIDIREFLIAAYDVSDLLNQQYTYHSLVKQMYLNLNNSSSEINNKLSPGKVFSILYAFNQECFVKFQKGDSKSDTTRFMRYEDFRNMSRDELEVMISLMDMKYAKSFTPLWREGQNEHFLTKDNAEPFRRWAGRIETTIEQFHKVQADYLKMTEFAKAGNKIDAVYSTFNVWENVNALIGVVVPDSSIQSPILKRVAKEMTTVKASMENAFEIYHQLSLKNYAGAVNSTISLVEKIIYQYGNDTARIKFSEIVSKSGSATFSDKFLKKYIPHERDSTMVSFKTDSTTISFNKASGRLEIKNKKDSVLRQIDSIRFTQQDYISSWIFEKDRHAINVIRRLGGFLNDVMLTNDSKQLSKVVESYAMPPGSYKRKRNSWWSFDLNAYVGGYVGYEIINGQKGKAGVYGITAPIGFSFSKTFGIKVAPNEGLKEDMIRNPDKIYVGNEKIRRRGNGTWTINLQVVDLGAVVSYRFGNTDTISKGLPESVKWAQLLSPGLRIGYGIPGTPIVFSAGYQYTPQLRRVTESADLEKGAHRLSLALMFDLPLFNFWQQSNRRR